MPLPAGTGLDRRTFLSRTLGAALTVYGASALGPKAFDAAIARAAAAGHGDRVLVTIFAPGGWDALSLLYPNGDPHYRRLRPEIALKPDDGPVLQERLAPALASVARAAREAARPREGHRLPGDRLLAPRPVALHLAPLLGGRRARSAARRPAGSAGSST